MTTWMCDNGYHGDQSRRYQSEGDDMWMGYCSGTVRPLEPTYEYECACKCVCHESPVQE